MRGGAALIFLTIAALLAGCGSDSSEKGSSSTDGKTQAAKTGEPKPKRDDPISCLERAGLDDVEKRDSDLWRGFTGQGLVIRVEKAASAKEAKDNVAFATAVVAKRVDSYEVYGPIKARDEGSVATVARCLAGG